MYQLYYYPNNASLAPHMLLEEIGAPFKLELVDRTQQAHKSANYLRLNPSGRIPVLVDGDLVIFEAAAICLYLAEQHPEANLLPAIGTPQRAHTLQWLMYLTNTLQTELLTYFYPERWTTDQAALEQVRVKAEERIGEMLDLLGAQLADGRSWFIGEQYTLVDAYLGMLCRWTRNLNRPARDLPQLAPYLQRLLARPAVQRALKSEGLTEPWV
ncbi:glutathione S-transferase N-terminal domain-containing protein [Chitinibacter bivalviorum]|uniref:Glutathione S-transferase N-terminal domain-containing protein n=1 Tax=Chitinibacter bivalviorum TaxID=2739434 RepID=A0A7H9BIE1_9NEIS|nr:glutathione S-transferase N-terminal domain-containing protein [Chitinibacter bivalviorum]QLG88493.1 glutathione S-transferase N-terminal domain-containing protein [Chitinibacter bivalviorum]